MWSKALSWVALFCSALAVLFNIGLPLVALAHAPHPGVPIAQILALVLAAAFLSSGPTVAIFTLLFRSPITRRYRYATAPAAFR